MGVLAAAGIGVESTAWAQQPPDTSLPDSARTAKPVSQGSTDITKEQFVSAERREEEAKNATELAVSAGGLLSGGNSRLVAATVAGRFRLRRESDQFRAALATNYGMAAQPKENWTTTVQNIQGLERYDRFFDNLTAFIAAQQRNDKFQGLELRLQIDPGVGYYFVNRGSELLWLEAGYDFRYDVRQNDARVLVDADGNPVLDAAGNEVILQKTAVVHSSRIFVGYEVKLSDTIQFTAGLEYLHSVTDSEVYRINGDASLQAKIRKQLAISLGFVERFENRPLPGKEQLDTTTSVSLVYSFF